MQKGLLGACVPNSPFFLKKIVNCRYTHISLSAEFLSTMTHEP